MIFVPWLCFAVNWATLSLRSHRSALDGSRDLNLPLSEDQLSRLENLADLVVEWNDRINLVSRKDCNPETVWERHILPSVAICATENPLQSASTVVDVGTGGGFPGLPLAIAYPEAEFLLLDSVGKKLTAVQDMAESLGLSNVQIHHGRAEELRGRRFDVATGRSVSALPQFCAWMHHLMQPETGRLMYWIGGEIEESVLSRVQIDIPVEELVTSLETDKRVLILSQSSVSEIADESGITVTLPNPPKKQRPARTKKPDKAKGSWQRRRGDENETKQRGYDNFQRYSS